jgi:cyanophycin synthetase
VCWFSTDENSSLIRNQLTSGGRAVFVRDGTINYHVNGAFETICEVADIPMTLQGAAVHNVQNALGVVGLCKALGLGSEAIVSGLLSFGSNALDNPGRGNIYQVKGCQVIVDFAHNEHGMLAVVDMARQLPANKYITMFGHGGDRSDEEIYALTDAVLGLGAELYIPVEVEKYLRGRELNEITAMVKQHMLLKGISNEHIQLASSPLAGAKQALAKASPGDVVLLFVLDERQEVHQWLSGL